MILEYTNQYISENMIYEVFKQMPMGKIFK